jgi:uncharacterized protein (DUF2235 family)
LKTGHSFRYYGGCSGWEAAVPRNLISLIDGTRISASQTYDNKSYSNVFELACLLQLDDGADSKTPQIVFYTSGIASQPDTSSIFNLLTGNSIRSQVVDQYTNICANFNFEEAVKGNPDRIYLFGFSRGAMAVRAVASLIAEFGLLHPRDIRFLPQILDKWDKSLGAGSLPDHIRRVNAEIDFIGLFDPVMGGLSGLSMFNPIRFHNSQLPAKCKHGVQILSIDENRFYFEPKRWEGALPGRRADGSAAPKRYLKQIWMPGVHADVGGTGHQVWGRAALLAMIFYIDHKTTLGLDRNWIKEKEHNLRAAIDHGNLMIEPHRVFMPAYVRKPSNKSDWHERRHPICDQLDALNYDGSKDYNWRELVFDRYFQRLDADKDLAAYFRKVLMLNGSRNTGRSKPTEPCPTAANVHEMIKSAPAGN